MYWHDVSWWAWMTMSVGMLVFWGLIAWGVALLLRARGGAAGGGPPSPQELLGERLARGEIDPREYRERMEALRSRGDRPRHPVA
jgi:putative membrane protein